MSGAAAGHADEFSAEDANLLNVYISTFTVAGLVVGVLLVVGAMRVRQRNKRARHKRLANRPSSDSSSEEGPDQATPVAAPSMDGLDDLDVQAGVLSIRTDAVHEDDVAIL